MSLLLLLVALCADSPGTAADLHLVTDKRVGQSSLVNCTSDTPFLPADVITIKNPGGHSVFHCVPPKRCVFDEQAYYHYILSSTVVLGINNTTMEHNGTWTCQLNDNSATGLLMVVSPAGNCGIQTRSVPWKMLLAYIFFTESYIKTSLHRRDG